MSTVPAVVEAREIVHPITREVRDTATAPLAWLGDVIHASRTVQEQLRGITRIASQEALARFDRAAKWTLRDGGWELKTQSPQPAVEWDTVGLYEDLRELLDTGVIDRSAFDDAIQEVVEYRVRANGIKQLCKRPEIAPIVNRHRREVPKTRYVTVRPPRFAEVNALREAAK